LLPTERLAGMTWLPAKRLRVLQIIRFCVIEMEPAAGSRSIPLATALMNASLSYR